MGMDAVGDVDWESHSNHAPTSHATHAGFGFFWRRCGACGDVVVGREQGLRSEVAAFNVHVTRCHPRSR